MGADGKNWTNQDDILHAMKYASSDRVFRIYDAIRLGIPLKTIYDITKMDYWFLRQLEELVSPFGAGGQHASQGLAA